MAKSNAPTINFSDQVAKEIKRYMPVIKRVAHPDCDVEALMGQAILVVQGSPKLWQCTIDSFGRAVAQAAQLNLEIGGALQHGTLVPFWNPTEGANECQFQVMAQGWKELVDRSGRVKSLWWHAVFAGDVFRIKLGTEPGIKHEPKNFEYKDEDLIHVYAVAILDNDEKVFFHMPRARLDKLRAANPGVKAGRGAPAWDQWFISMAETKVLKHFCKSGRIPRSRDLARAVSFDDAAETGDPSIAQTDIPALEAEHGLRLPDTATKTDRLIARVGAEVDPDFDPLKVQQ